MLAVQNLSQAKFSCRSMLLHEARSNLNLKVSQPQSLGRTASFAALRACRKLDLLDVSIRPQTANYQRPCLGSQIKVPSRGPCTNGVRRKKSHQLEKACRSFVFHAMDGSSTSRGHTYLGASFDSRRNGALGSGSASAAAFAEKLEPRGGATPQNSNSNGCAETGAPYFRGGVHACS